MTDWNKKKCYICGGYGADSGDHVPPKGVLPKDYRHLGKDLIKVPAHKTCNNGQKLDDEYLQTQLALLAFGTSEPGDALWDHVFKNLQRPEAIGLTKKIYQEFKATEVGKFDQAHGSSMIPKKININRICSVIERTARGINYFRTKSVLPPNWSVLATHISHKEEEDFERKMARIGLERFNSFANGSFRYIWLPKDKSDINGIYIFIFFNKIYFTVLLGDAGRQIQ